MIKLKKKIFLKFNYKNMCIQLKKFTHKNITTKYLNWLNDKKLMRYSRHRHNKHNLASVNKYINEMENNLFLTIFLKKKKNFIHIGNLSIYFDEKNKSASISILIGSINHRNKGIGKIIWTKTLDRLKKFQSLEVISAGTHYKNFSMIKIFNSSKMKVFKKGNKVFSKIKIKKN